MSDDFDEEAPTIRIPRETLRETAAQRPTRNIRPPAACRQYIPVVASDD